MTPKHLTPGHLTLEDLQSLHAGAHPIAISDQARHAIRASAAIVFLTPFGSEEPLLFLRQCLTEQGRPNLEWFYDQFPFKPGYANCGINIADKWDIRRLVLSSLGRQPASRPPRTAESILSA